ncbi:MAG: aminotransferase [Rhodobacteraceae bacterium]|nr:aminotransferase [Paracoccaceae bacterium]
MHSPLNPCLIGTVAPPIMEACGWVNAADLPADKPLLNISQAAPADPPPLGLRQAMAQAVMEDPTTHVYGPAKGLPALREQVAADWSVAYGGRIGAENVAITAGCNQAFCAAIATLAAPGDSVILSAPWYFNHKMWLDMAAVETRVHTCGADLLPDPGAVAALINSSTRAIILVSPNNPTGAEYPVELVRAFYELAHSRGLALIIDETYRDFHSETSAPHDLFTDPDWDQTLIQLYSFSKAYRLTGHRVGTLITSQDRLTQAEKFLDTMTICPGQLGQRAALWGMKNLGVWLAREREEILRRRAAVVKGFKSLPGWTIKGCGAYFAYAAHPFDLPSDAVARRIVEEAAVLLLPGTMFGPARAEGGTGMAEAHVRIAFANVDTANLARVVERLSCLDI